MVLSGRKRLWSFEGESATEEWVAAEEGGCSWENRRCNWEAFASLSESGACYCVCFLPFASAIRKFHVGGC